MSLPDPASLHLPHKLPLVNFDPEDKLRFGREVVAALQSIGFFSVRHYSRGLRGRPNIGTLKNHMHRLFTKFSGLPLETKAKYHGIEWAGQRGFIYPGMEQSGKAAYAGSEEADPCFEMRENWMHGQNLHFIRSLLPSGAAISDHPYTQLRPFFYLENPSIAEVPGLEIMTDRLMAATHRQNLLLSEGLELALGLSPGHFAARLAWGNHFIRLMHYHAIPKENILGETEWKGVKTLRVKLYKTEISGKEMYGVSPTNDSSEEVIFDHVVRASNHQDIDLLTGLLGANIAGLHIIARDGSRVPFTAQGGELVINSGDYLAWETGGFFPSSFHYVQFSSELAQTARFSYANFLHMMPTARTGLLPQFADRPEAGSVYERVVAEMLWDRLVGIHFMTPEVKAQLMANVLPSLPTFESLQEHVMRWEVETFRTARAANVDLAFAGDVLQLTKYLQPDHYRRELERAA